MAWRVFSVLNALIVFSTVLGPFASSHHSLLGLIAIGMSVPAAGGVYLYAFEKPATRSLWSAFSWLFAADSIGVIVYFAMRIIEVGPHHRPAAMAILFALVVAYQYFTWLAICRLSGKRLPLQASAGRKRDEPFTRVIAEAAENHPGRAKALAWCLLAVLVAVAPLVVWHAIAEGKAYKLLLPSVIGIVCGLKSYASAKAARQNR
jgi:hypothetical protein